MPPFAYVTLAMLVIWAFLFVVSERTRLEQLAMSALGLILSPTALALVAADHRSGSAQASVSPGIAEFVFSAAMFGIAAVACHLALHAPAAAGHARIAAWRGARLRIRSATLSFVAPLLIVAGAWLFVAVAVQLTLAIPPVPALALSGVMMGLHAVADRKDLLLDALVTGTVIAALVFSVEQVFFVRLFPEAAAAFWSAENLSGILLAGIPISELLWAAVVGFTAGPMYEYVRQRHLA
ncbi:hypothetical protein EPO34_04145 [Patescibacteria group bacterium]|nr:MAG: hypothetical protein EPO34_04145 [Patescibacteria group bacterium]